LNYNEFKFAMVLHGIDERLVKACEHFIIKENSWVLKRPIERRTEHSDLGYAELADITSLDQCLLEIKDAIEMSTCDYDSLGRSLEKLRTKQLYKEPGKLIKRIMLKAFYLQNGTI